MSQQHLRHYNPFVEFKKDVRAIINDFKIDMHNILNRHIQMSNIVVGITIMGFGGLGGGLVMLYQKTESDKNELNAKLDLILMQISTPKKT